MSISRVGLSSAGDGDRDPVAVAQRSRPLHTVPDLGNAEGTTADETEVRVLHELRPVPPALRSPTVRSGSRGASRGRELDRAKNWPAYDPYTARRRRAPEWLVSYTAALVVGDLAAVGLALVAAKEFVVPRSALGPLLAALSVLAWPALQALLGSYAERRLGTGMDEYRRVTVAGLLAVALLSFAAPLGVPDVLRLVAVPSATLLTLGARMFNRRRLHAARRRGAMTKRVVVVGREGAVIDLVRRLRRDPSAGLRVVGACVPRPMRSARLVEEGIVVLGGLDDAVDVLEQIRADAVLVASASETAGHYLRDLAWRLEGTNVELLVGPGVIEVAPNRLHVRPTTSMPLVHIREPEFRGVRRVLKSAFDRTAAAALLVLAAPVFVGIAVAVRATSPGPAFYRQRRIGKQGVEFDLLKFRSMRTDRPSDEALMALNEGNAVQFKLRQDPRVTPLGRVLRRYSLDELPQLINVLKGEMSLVGPRPHVMREVEQYGPDMRRRLLVPPGLTGLWQVSGRSDLSWDDSVELDVRYVENWSLGLDLHILWRTLRAVLASSGAY